MPVDVAGKYLQKTKDTRVADPGWPKAHWRTIAHNYAQAAYFRQYRDFFEDQFLGCQEEFLSRINYRFLTSICRLLEIDTPITWSKDYEAAGSKTERLVDLCRQAGATEYISGPSAKDYLDEAQFQAAGIAVRWMDYSGYPEYPQVHPPFDHAVSIVDLILNTGPDARKYMKVA